jgi:hypothetical protein
MSAAGPQPTAREFSTRPFPLGHGIAILVISAVREWQLLAIFHHATTQPSVGSFKSELPCGVVREKRSSLARRCLNRDADW